MQQYDNVPFQPTVGFQQVVDSIPLRVFWKDRSSKFLGCNELFARDAGVKTDEIAGLTDFDLAWRSEEAEFYQQTDQRVMESNVAQRNIIEPQRNADGSEAWLDTTKVPIHSDCGVVIGVVCCYDVVTERVQTEQEHAHYRRHLENLILEEKKARTELEGLVPEAQKTESLRLMAGGIAHDFNNMLAAILGFGEILDSVADDPAQVRKIGQGITSACQSAADLCGQLAVFSGNVIDSEDSVDLNKLVSDMQSLLAASVGAAIEIQYVLSAEPVICKGPTTKLQQVLLNLVVNAAEAMEPGGTIRIKTGVNDYTLQRLDRARLNCAAFSGEYSYFEVSDSGAGISDDDNKRIFDPFFTTKQSGRGLGLAALCGIVDAQKGAVELETEIGTGSTFRLLFPAHAQSSKAPVGLGRQTLDESTSIMLVDDGKQFLDVMESLLAACGCRVIAFDNGASAIVEFQQRRNEIDVVILDVQMPGMDGLTVMRELKRIEKAVPIILATGYVEPALRDQLSSYTDVMLIEKPFPVERLLELVARAKKRV